MTAIFLKEKTENKESLFELKSYQIDKLNRLLRQTKKDSKFRMEEIYTTVQRRDIIVYAEREDYSLPLWSTVGELRWGLKHVLTSYDKYCGNINVEKPHTQHWTSLLSWCDLDEDAKFIPALRLFSQKIAAAEKITDFTDFELEKIKEKEKEGIERLVLQNKDNKLFLILDTLKDTGYILSGWSQDVRN